MEADANLNDFFYFVQIVKHGGFSAAANALNVPKSRLSRRLATLEKRLGVQLLQRSTRKLSLTQTGVQLMQHCETMLHELEVGVAEIAEQRQSPKGKLRIGCSMNAARVFVGSAVTGFLQRYPDMQVEVKHLVRGETLQESEVDLAFRVTPTLEDGRYVAKRLWESPQVLVASPILLRRFSKISGPEDLTSVPTLELTKQRGRHTWVLTSPDGQKIECAHKPRLLSDDIEVIHQAALRGAGVTRLPVLICAQDLITGALISVLPAWRIPPRQLYAVFLSRPGLSPAARIFFDYVVEWFEAQPNWDMTG